MTESCCCTYILPYLYIKYILSYSAVFYTFFFVFFLFSIFNSKRKATSNETKKKQTFLFSRLALSLQKKYRKIKKNERKIWCSTHQHTQSAWQATLTQKKRVANRRWDQRINQMVFTIVSFAFSLLTFGKRDNVISSCLTRLCVIDGGCARCEWRRSTITHLNNDFSYFYIIYILLLCVCQTEQKRWNFSWTYSISEKNRKKNKFNEKSKNEER